MKTTKFELHESDKMDNNVRYMMAHYEQAMLLKDNLDLAPRIVCEELPAGSELLQPLLNAMRQGLRIAFNFTDFGEEPVLVEGDPYCLKAYERRWYIVVHNEEETTPYCLDRITNLDTLDEHFRLPDDFSPKAFFQHSVGVRAVPDEQPQCVRLKVDAGQMPYLRAQPLHPTQREVSRNEYESVIELQVVPTTELTMKILSMGSLVEVLEPQELADDIMITAAGMYHCYNRRAAHAPYQAEEGAVRMRLKVAQEYAGELRLHPIHDTQREIASGIFEYHVVPDFELEQKILAMGRYAEVWEPQSLVDNMRETADQMYRTYFKIPDDAPFLSRFSDDVHQLRALVCPRDFNDILVGRLTKLTFTFSSFLHPDIPATADVRTISITNGDQGSNETAIIEITKVERTETNEEKEEDDEDMIVLVGDETQITLTLTLGRVVEKNLQPRTDE